ncbi:type II secretion system protein GspM [Xanthobacter sp. V4C-4]|uniref:type II secretion system protein GspM n=1 Tax=Xanthobacter cornucopiae TaxID=3119924 RepID=UPI00372A4178
MSGGAPGFHWRPLAAVLGYVALVGMLAALALGTVLDLMERRAAVDAAAGTLERLQARRLVAAGGKGAGPGSGGSPFLDGPTLTIAGASLMQRLSGAVARFGGHIASSHVELQGTPFGPDFVAVSASLDIAQDEFQKLLYDLEAGMPFLFVGQLAVRPERTETGPPGGEGATGAADPERLQVTLTVYGQWRRTP